MSKLQQNGTRDSAIPPVTFKVSIPNKPTATHTNKTNQNGKS